MLIYSYIPSSDPIVQLHLICTSDTQTDALYNVCTYCTYCTVGTIKMSYMNNITNHVFII